MNNIHVNVEKNKNMHFKLGRTRARHNQFGLIQRMIGNNDADNTIFYKETPH